MSLRETPPQRAAAGYVDSLKRLLDLPPALDPLSRDGDAPARDLRLLLSTLRKEEQRLAHLDQLTRMAIEAVGGIQSIRACVHLEIRERSSAAADGDSRVRGWIQGIWLCGAARSDIYGVDCLPPTWEDGDKQRLIDVVRNPTSMELCRSADNAQQASEAMRPSMERLKRALKDFGVNTIAAEMQAVNNFVAEIQNRLSIAEDAASAKGAQEEVRRLQAARKLETERSGLIARAADGMLRCLGGPSILRFSPVKPTDALESLPPDVAAILDRESRYVMTRGADSSEDFDQKACQKAQNLGGSAVVLKEAASPQARDDSNSADPQRCPLGRDTLVRDALLRLEVQNGRQADAPGENRVASAADPPADQPRSASRPTAESDGA